MNIEALLESLAEVGGICISESAFQQIENKLPLRYGYRGEHQVKNIVGRFGSKSEHLFLIVRSSKEQK